MKNKFIFLTILFLLVQRSVFGSSLAVSTLTKTQAPVKTKTKPKVHPNTQPIMLNKDSAKLQPQVQIKVQTQTEAIPKVQVPQKVKVVQTPVKVQPKAQAHPPAKAQKSAKVQTKDIAKTQPIVTSHQAVNAVAKVPVKVQAQTKLQPKTQVRTKIPTKTIPQAKIQSITPIAVIKPIGAISTPGGISAVQTQTQIQPVDFSACTKTFKIDSQKLFYLTLSGVNANRFSIDEIKSLTGYVIFTASQKQFLAIVIKIDSKTSMLKIVPCNNTYLFPVGIVQNMFKYVELNANTPVENLKIL